jgi:hypothetical protein
MRAGGKRTTKPAYQLQTGTWPMRVPRLAASAHVAEALPAPATAHHATVHHVANPCFDEPDARVGHVRICGSPEGAILRGDPAIAGYAIGACRLEWVPSDGNLLWVQACKGLGRVALGCPGNARQADDKGTR